MIVVRAALPYAVKWYVNKVLGDIPGYYGHIEDIDLSIWRGAYQIEDLRFMKVNNKIREPYFSAKVIDLSVDWKALWKGTIATRIEMDHPQFTIIKGKSGDTTQITVDEKWQTQVQKLYPFKINSLLIHGGGLRFKNETTDPKIDVNLSALEAKAENLTNATDEGKNLFATIDAQSKIQESGAFRLSMKINPISDPMQADFNAKIEDLNMVELNDFAQAYGNFDFEKGKASVYSEFVTAKNDFTGYAKVIFVGLDVLDWEKEKNDNPFHKLWEGIVGAGFEILENQGKDQFAMRLPFSGKLDDVEVNSWKSFWSIFTNAFISAFSKKLEDSFDFSSLKASGAK